MVIALQTRFPLIQGPRGEDICYATSNRQAAVKAIATQCDAMLVIGAPNSSNSQRLAELAERQGVKSRLIQRASEIDFDWLGTPNTVGLTAGASAPEVLVREVIELLATRFSITADEITTATEDMVFKMPRELVA
jgi:4-hydroxy-3-methylbut-2-en-1-yl diphosphate reductase